MGLDISPGDAQWSYSGFGRFRERLAAVEGIDLHEMKGFGSVGKSWDGVDTPLKPLLDHSDCDGYLRDYECEQVIPRLREIIATWPESDYDRRSAEALIAGMEHCAEHGCALVFH